MINCLLPDNISVFAFDFAGAGRSEGDLCSLGYYERGDLDTVLAHIQALRATAGIALWGRSMGAATALMVAAAPPPPLPVLTGHVSSFSPY